MWGGFVRNEFVEYVPGRVRLGTFFLSVIGVSLTLLKNQICDRLLVSN